jgi:hypothetical protein
MKFDLNNNSKFPGKLMATIRMAVTPMKAARIPEAPP